MPFQSQAWLQNVKQIVLGRQPWRPEDEYAYYCVTGDLVRAHAENQVRFEREAHVFGLELARSMGILDTERLRNSRVLDIGAGECALTAALAIAARAAEVVAVDAVPKQIWAPASQHRDVPNLKFVIADAANLPYEVGSFDLALAHLMLHHIEPIGPVFAEMFRVLRPGGQFVAMEPAPIAGMLGHHEISKNEAPVAARVFAEQARNAGFIDIEIKYWWHRMSTSILGPFSPGYRLVAKVPGSSAGARVRLRRPLAAMKLPGLLIDTACRFEHTAVKQAQDIIAVFRTLSGIDGFRGLN
jgi:ubiquinone/menaquinone biosynthesis C-methylase UbiE